MPVPLPVPCLSGSRSHSSLTLGNLCTKNIWYVLGVWEARKHLVSLGFHSRLSHKENLQPLSVYSQAGSMSQAQMRRDKAEGYQQQRRS